jgi:hypothetical protein
MENGGTFIAISNILQVFGLFYGHLVWFAVLCYNFPVLVYCTKKTLAVLVEGQMTRSEFFSFRFEANWIPGKRRHLQKRTCSNAGLGDRTRLRKSRPKCSPINIW